MDSSLSFRLILGASNLRCGLVIALLITSMFEFF